jgi:hypothetical protein
MSGTRRPQAGACPLDGRVGRHAGERMHSCATKPARLRPANWSLPSGDHWLRSHARAPRTVTRRGHDAPGHEPRQAPRGSWGTVVRQPPKDGWPAPARAAGSSRTAPMQRFSVLSCAISGREERDGKVLGLPCPCARLGGCDAAMLLVFLRYKYRAEFRAVAHFLTPNV